MSFFNRLRFLPVVSLLFAVAAAQVCYYPDGLTVSNDVPCNTDAAASSCCPTGSFCMDNGLCFGGGIISRSSCTDQTWDSSECAQYCKDDDTSISVSLTPCDADTRTFTCGLNNTQCTNPTSAFTMNGGNALVLRQSQIQALTESYTTTPSHNIHIYTASALIGVALGIGLPLLSALILCLLVLRKERQRMALKLLWEQDQQEEHHLQQEQQRQHTSRAPAIHIQSVNSSRRSFSTISRSGTMTTVSSTYKPQQQPKAFMEKYGYHKGYYAHDGDLGVSVFELPTNEPKVDDGRVEAP